MTRRIQSSSLKIGSIQPSRPIDAGQLRFSFRHLDFRHQKFATSRCQVNYLCKLLERLKDLSPLKAEEVMNDRSTALRSHPIRWKDTSEPRGFAHLGQQLVDVTAYQLSVSRQGGRFHGFFLDDIFFVVWLDPDHLLYPGT